MSTFDAVIVGGGVVGLWVLGVLRKAGFHAVLLEKAALGAGQTLAAQGIIHGGTKYALTGKLNHSSEAVRAMPRRWRQHLDGQCLPDLEQVVINTEKQLMWDTGGLTSPLSSFFASKLMSSRVRQLVGAQCPEILSGKTVYQLDEPVVDVRSLVCELSRLHRDYCFKAEVEAVSQRHDICSVTASGQTLAAHLVINCAGEGNGGLSESAMQCRPLHMVTVSGVLPPLWGHIISAHVNPALTITSHKIANDRIVWYLGGQLAEEGNNRRKQQQLQVARRKLQNLIPDTDWSDTRLRWDAFMVNRAEGKRPDGKRPNEPVVDIKGRVITTWPVKLVFAPLVADRIFKHIQSVVAPSGPHDALQLPFPAVSIARYPWDKRD